MSSRTIVPVEEYLKTNYRPDCDYIDGVVEERNVGDNDHAHLQKQLLLFLSHLERKLEIYVVQEQRVQVSATRFRVSDTCVMLGGRPAERIFTKPPLICIEILSPDDRFYRVPERIDNYLQFGVREVWVVDPKTRRAWVHTPSGSKEIRDGALRFERQRDAPEIIVPLNEIFD